MPRRSRLFSFALFSLLVAAGATAASGQGVVPSSRAAIAMPAHAATARTGASRRGAREGIQIHGQWVIEVRNREGKVTGRREFENAIQPAGMAFLGALIEANGSSSGLIISINGSSQSQGPCTQFAPLSGNSNCLIVLPPNGQGFIGPLATGCPKTVCSNNLTVTAPSFSSNTFTGSQIVLAGSVPASSAAGNIEDVETVFAICQASETPNGCEYIYNPTTQASNGDYVYSGNFTMLTLDGKNGDPAAIAFSTGDTIAVTVTISFSSPSLSGSSTTSNARR
jgi:hypothetical protein